MIQGSVYLASSPEPLFSHINKTESFIERSRGLLGCKRIEDGHGLLISPCNSIHTFFMCIPIDVLFLNKDNLIIGIKHNLRPWRFAIFLRAACVLELMAGQIQLSGLKTGDRLIWKNS